MSRWSKLHRTKCFALDRSISSTSTTSSSSVVNAIAFTDSSVYILLSVVVISLLMIGGASPAGMVAQGGFSLWARSL